MPFLPPIQQCQRTEGNPWGCVIQHIPVPVPKARINWGGGCGKKGIQRKNGGIDGGGLLISMDGVAPSRIVGVFARSTLNTEEAFFWYRLTWVIPEKGP